MISIFLEHAWSGATLAALVMASAQPADSGTGGSEAAGEAKPDFGIEPGFEELAEFTIAGIATFGTPLSGRFPELWHHYQGALTGAVGIDANAFAYGLELYPPDPTDQHFFTYMAGNIVTDPAAVPVYLLTHTLPAARYAVFRVPGGVSGLAATFPFIYRTWLPQSGFVRAHPFDFERYNLSVPAPTVNDIPLEILVPIALR